MKIDQENKNKKMPKRFLQIRCMCVVYASIFQGVPEWGTRYRVKGTGDVIKSNKLKSA